MKACPEMKVVIEQLIAKHKLDLQHVGSQFCLESPGFDCLHIARISRCCLAVAHCFEVGNALILEPEVVFFIGLDGATWIPIEITHFLTGWHPVAVLSQDGTKILVCNQDQQAKVANFAESWAENLRAQDWLAEGTQRTGHHSTNREK